MRINTNLNLKMDKNFGITTEKKIEKSFNFMVMCKNCNEILGNSNLFEKIHMLLNEIAIIITNKTNQMKISSELLFQSKNEGAVDYQCVFKDIECNKCHVNIGVFYISTTELLDSLKENIILFESKLKMFSISENKVENFREFCFENEMIQCNFDNLHIINDKKQKKNSLNITNNDEFPELNLILTEVKNAFSSMNEGMKVFETRLSQSEKTVGVLLTMMEKLNKKIQKVDENNRQI